MTRQPTFIFGVIEGFYGVFYTFPERRDLIRFLGRHGYNFYLYGPKNDRQHRARWWEAYPERIMAEFAETVAVAHEAGLTFCYATSPGISICYSDPAEFERLTAKLRAFFDIGVRAFCLAMDDNQPGFRHAADAEAYPSLPAAQADLANRLLAWLKALDPACTLSFCPAEYHGSAPFSPALTELGAALHAEIDLYYTGPEICAPTIHADDAHLFAQATGRRPLIWDNYPVNDLAMTPDLHLGPIRGRSAGLPEAVRGILVNPMCAAEASKIPLLTYAAYLNDPAGYRPAAAFEAAVAEIAGPDYAAPVRLLAEVCDHSCLARGGETLTALAVDALVALQVMPPGACDSGHPAICALEAYLTDIDEAGYVLKFRQENLALRNNLLPWIEIFEHWMWLTRFALRLHQALDQGQDILPHQNRVEEYRQMVLTHPKRIATQALLPLVDFIRDRAVEHQKLAVEPEFYTPANVSN